MIILSHDVHLSNGTFPHLSIWTGQSEIEQACDQLFKKAESIDYRYDVQDETVEGLLILPLYGSMASGKFDTSSISLIMIQAYLFCVFLCNKYVLNYISWYTTFKLKFFPLKMLKYYRGLYYRGG